MFLENNLLHLAARSCHVLDSPELDEEPGRVQFLAAKNGAMTCKVFADTAEFLFHSRYDPLAEAKRMVAAQLGSQELSSRIVVYGFGCGHHIRALLELLPAEEVEVDVVETNVSLFKQILKHDDFTDLIGDDRVRFTVTDRPARLAERAAEWEAVAPAWIIHEPSLRVIPNHLDGFRLALEGLLAHLKSVIAFRPLMEDNFAANVRLGLSGIGRFIGQFPDVPAVLVSAGPSLVKNVDLLQEARKHCLIGCVGTALGPLRQRGVVPDFFMITDPQPKVIGQVEQAPPDIPMFVLSTVYPGVPEGYGGPRFIVYQKDYPPAEEWASKVGEPLVRTGGSVATTLFDVLVQMGCDPICLVGQDL
ncbi:6-hydroxymethylpterin diphosphokinase MptE-like protein, partial [Kyrpidia sp.]|uniref:motility associated factor glycosyltransferase family protein n=1 Tax=Kyrpidia sp. TaxID=2073077 RepID=UPI00258B6E3A